MEAKKILQANLLDILFEGRNKNYGAYELRTNYNARLYKAVGAMLALCFIFFGTLLLASSGNNSNPRLVVSSEINISNVDDPKPKQVEAPKIQKPVQAKVVKDVIVKIVPDPQADTTPPTVDEQLNSNIGKQNVAGENIEVINAPVETGTSNKPIINLEKIKEGFDPVQIAAQYPGGANAWQIFLEHNLRSDIPTENGAPVGRYTVIVSFTVDEEGNISDIQADNNPGYGTAEEALRVIKRSNKWIPALQNGKNVIYRQKQGITFVVEENG